MYTELSHYLLILAIFLALFQQYLRFFWIVSLYTIISTICFFSAMSCYMCSDFSIYNIFTNSNANTPLLFLISATWSNHEGSLLLWCWLLSIFGFWFCYCIQPWKVSLQTMQMDYYLTFGHPTNNSTFQHDFPLSKLNRHMLKASSQQHLFLFQRQTDIRSVNQKQETSTGLGTVPLFVSHKQSAPRQRSDEGAEARSFASALPKSLASLAPTRNFATGRERPKGRGTSGAPEGRLSAAPLNLWERRAHQATGRERRRPKEAALPRSLVFARGSFGAPLAKLPAGAPSSLLWERPFGLLTSRLAHRVRSSATVGAISPPQDRGAYIFFRSLTLLDRRERHTNYPKFGDVSRPWERPSSKRQEERRFASYVAAQERLMPSHWVGSLADLFSMKFTTYNTKSTVTLQGDLNQWYHNWVHGNYCANLIDKQHKIQPLRIYVSILLFFCTFLLATSNPFFKIPFMCVNSVAELNPVLQDPILAIHPPCIYAGYVASAVGFSICLSKLMQVSSFDMVYQVTTAFVVQLNKCSVHLFGRRVPQAPVSHRTCFASRILQRFFKTNTEVNNMICGTLWTEMWIQIRIWILICWCFLTVGILLGSWWAYHELGWGGWWFWDPVENASLMPWLLATACIHSVLIPRLNFWTLLLNLFTFVLSILGTFFVRSGLLASVHSFATDSTRGLFILCFLSGILLISTLQLVKYNSKSVTTKYNNTTMKLSGKLGSAFSFKTLLQSESVSNFEIANNNCKMRRTNYYQKCFAQKCCAHTIMWLPSWTDAKRKAIFAKRSLEELDSSADVWSTARSNKALFVRSVNTGLGATRGCLVDQRQTSELRERRFASLDQATFGSAAFGKPAGGRNDEGALTVGSAVPIAAGNARVSEASKGVAASAYKVAPEGATKEPKSFNLRDRAACRSLVSLCSTKRPVGSAASQSSTALPEVERSRRQATFGSAASLRSTKGCAAAQAGLSFGCALNPAMQLNNNRANAPKVTKNKRVFFKTRPEQLLLVQNFFLFIITVIILCGTAAPILFQLFNNRDVSTGAPFFNGTIVPIFTCILLMLISIHSLQLRAASTKGRTKLTRKHKIFVTSSVFYVIWLLLVFHCFMFSYVVQFSVLESVYAVICFMLFCSIFLSTKKALSIQYDERFKQHKSIPSRLVILTEHFQTVTANMKIAHTGIVMFITGVLFSNRKKTQFTQIMRSGYEVRLGNQICCLRSIDQNYGPTFRSICGNVIVYQQQQQKITSHRLLHEINKTIPLFNNTKWFCGDSTSFHSSYAMVSDLKVPLIKNVNTKMYCNESALVASLIEHNQTLLQLLQISKRVSISPSPQFTDVFVMFPEKRFFLSNQELSTTKVAIHTNLLSDIYTNIGAGSTESGWFVTIMQLPYIFCIWVGFMLAAIGGFNSVQTILKQHKLNWQ